MSKSSLSVSDPLASARLKVERASHHASALKQTIERWLEDRPYSLSIEDDAETGENACVIHVERVPPREWSVVAGEAVHNLRSALDHAVYALSAPQPDGKPLDGTEFPIFVDKPKFESVKRGGGLYKARGLSVEALAVVESVQPFHHGKDPTSHPLWVLQELSNVDKHRLLYATGTVLGTGNFKLNPTGGVRIKSFKIRDAGPVKDGAKIALWSGDLPPGSEGQVTVEGDIAYGVAFDEDGPAKGEPIQRSFDLLGPSVASILRMLGEAA